MEDGTQREWDGEGGVGKGEAEDDVCERKD